MNCSYQSLINESSCFDCIPRGMQGAVQAMLACNWAEGGGGGACDDPVVLDWLQRLADDFQPIPSQDTINAVCDFCLSLRIAGIMDKMLVVNPIIPDSFLAMRYPLIWQPANGNSPFINVNFVAADLDNNGLLGAGLLGSKYMDSGFSPFVQWAAALDSAGLSMYCSEPAVAGGFIDFGCYKLADDDFFQFAAFDGADRGAATCWNIATNFTSGAGPFAAFYSWSRTSLILITCRNANTTTPLQTIGTNNADQSLASIPNLSSYFMAQNPDAAASDFTQNRISFLAVHEGLSQSETQSLYDAVYNLRFALGGGYV